MIPSIVVCATAVACLLVAAVVVVGLASATLRWLHPQIPTGFRVVILSYVGVISVIVVASIGAVAAGAPVILALGAIVFAISDLFVVRPRFVTEGFVNAGLGLPSHFGAQFLLAYPARFGSGT